MDQCNVIQQQLSEFIDGEITAEDAAASLLHSGSCRQCRTFLSSMLMMRSASAHIFSAKVPQKLDDRIYAIPNS